MKKISILGSTGSIGTQTLDVVRRSKGMYKVLGLSSYSNIDLIEKQADEFDVSIVCVVNEKKAKELQLRRKDLKVLSGENGMIEISVLEEIQTLVVAVVGRAGIKPTFAAINASKDIALANKEVLATSGIEVMKKSKEKGVSIRPIDSEHSAIYQVMRAGKFCEIKKVWLTASGGPFLDKEKWPIEKLRTVTPKQALAHPTWNMGEKISIDSATLANKGLEIIEAVRLFNLEPDQIEVVIHPESILHSAVEFVDGSIVAELGKTDMRRCISYAISGEDRYDIDLEPLNLFKTSLHFKEPDRERFPCLSLAEKAVRIGGEACSLFSDADEEAVRLFLNGEIGFIDIWKRIEDTMNDYLT